MEIPENCRSCRYEKSCPAPHYGGSRCRYEKQINERTVRAILETRNIREEDK